MKFLKIFGSILAFLLIIGLIVFFFALGKIVDGSKNKAILTEMPTVSEAAKKLHSTLTIADWHSDNLLWDRNPLDRSSRGHVDIPRLIEGNFTLQVFDAVIKSPSGLNYDANSAESRDNITPLSMGNRWPIRTWTSLCERALYQSEILHKAEKNSEGKLKIVKNKRDLNALLQARNTNKNLVGGLLSIEGLHALEGKIENLDKCYDAGYRLMGLVHFFDNKLGGSSAGVEKGGITEFGKEVLKKMEEKGIMLDLAHASSDLIKDVMKLTDMPMVVSHTGVRGTKNSIRNLTDEEVKMVADKGGLIGIGFWKEAVGSTDPADIVKAMRYVVNLVGIDHVSLGSDFDGSVTTYFDASQIVVLTEAMLKAGFTESEIRKIMGENQINFLKRHLPD